MAQAIPTYMMSIFKLPNGLIEEIHAMLARFWWGSTETASKMHWQRWELLCRPKALGGLGFRDLKCFNKALLAKQMWRLHHNPGTFIHLVLKAKYFKNCDVLEASVRYDPSYAWRSMWGAKELLLEGLKWRVGNGSKINVWCDAWLPGNTSYLVPTPTATSNMDMRVIDLIDHNSNSWDINIITSTFNEAEKAMILTIPLSPNCPPDKMYWWPTKDGAYNVKSGYWLAKKVQNSAAMMDMDTVWRLIWSLVYPPKLKHFLWRACKGFLAVKERLFYRHIVTDKTCSICNCPEESIIHSTFECSAANDIWAASSYSTLIQQAPNSSFLERFLWLSKNVSRGELVIIAALAWASWHCRNLKIFEQGAFNAVEVAKGWVNLVRESNEYAGKVTCRAGMAGSTIASSWSCPRQGHVKVNCDAHLGARTGLGVVIRDEQGAIIAAAVRQESAGWGVEIAEAAACYFGLVIARRLGFVRVQLETNAINVVRAVTQKPVGFSPVYMIYEDIIRLSSCFSLFSFSHVKRAGNTLAHNVAKWDPRGCNEFVSLGPFPQSLTTSAEIDLI